MTPREKYANEAFECGLMAWMGYARSGHELALRDSLADMVHRVDAPRVVEAVSRGKDRKPKLVDKPHLPNHILITARADQQSALIEAQRRGAPEVAGLSRTFQPIPLRLLYSLHKWSDEIEAVAQDVIDRHRMGEELSQFKAGEVVRVIDRGSEFFAFFEAQQPIFLKMVQAAHDPHPFAEVEVQVFGRAVPVKVDPLYVKKGAA